MTPIDIRYWIKLHSRSHPIETISLKTMKKDIERNPDAKIVVESIYPDRHEFKFDNKVHKIHGEMSDSSRDEYITRLFNKSDQYFNQVMRKKTTTKHKNK